MKSLPYTSNGCIWYHQFESFPFKVTFNLNLPWYFHSQNFLSYLLQTWIKDYFFPLFINFQSIWILFLSSSPSYLLWCQKACACQRRFHSSVVVSVFKPVLAAWWKSCTPALNPIFSNSHYNSSSIGLVGTASTVFPRSLWDQDNYMTSKTKGKSTLFSENKHLIKHFVNWGTKRNKMYCQ